MRAAAVLALLAAAALAGCSDDEPGATTPEHTLPSTPAEPAWNPCDALDPAPVSRALGAEVTLEAGTPEAPRCSLLPVEPGGPTLNVTYAWTQVGLAETIDQLQLPEGVDVRTPEVAGADDARLVVNVRDDAAAVTGFVDDGDLVQTVNALDLAPHDAATLVAATTEVVRQLSAAAPEEP